jgi:hypothetical protein
MSRHPELYRWITTVADHFPGLSKPLAAGLAWWSLGMILARSCALSAVAGLLGALLGQSFHTVRERLRDTYREASAKAGTHRAELDVSECWAPWLAWVLEGWSGQQVALALDATTLGQRFVALVISVLYRGCAVPVAWKILPATEKPPWQPEWLALLKHFSAVVPPGWTVIVLADRGLYAKWLFQAIQALGWHPLLRINQQGTFRPRGWYHWVPLTQLVPAVGRSFASQGTAFHCKKAQLECTLLGRWDAGYKEAWLVLTDLSPQAADVCWYGLRAWIEQGFKRIKRGGWQWQYTRMDDPARATAVARDRLGHLVVAVRRRRGRSRFACRNLADRPRSRSAAEQRLAFGRDLSPRLEFDCCGFAQPSDDPHRARCPGTLANSATDGMLDKKPTLVRPRLPGRLDRPPTNSATN